jgi:tetratricopeptide (TPR) repeat protein
VLYEQGTVFYQWGSALEQAKKTQQAVGKYDKASQTLKKSLDLEPKPDLMVLLGNVLFDQARALKTLGKQTEATPRYQQAIDYYEKYLEVNPNNADVRTDLGIAYFEKGDSDIAIANFNQVIAANPQHAKAWFNLGYVSDSSGKKAEAIKAWKQYLKIESSGPNADYAKSRLKELEG